MKSSPAVPDVLKMSENALLEAVLALAKVTGYLATHFRPARKGSRLVGHDDEDRPIFRDEWRTEVQGDNGYPDLTLAGHGRLILAELKSDTGSLSADQSRWRMEIEAAQIEYYLWRPQDWHAGRIAIVLERR